MYVLYLNNMQTCSHFEDGLPVCWADTKKAIEAFLEQETVEVYTDPKSLEAPDGAFWGKTFRKGGPLEWFNRLPIGGQCGSPRGIGCGILHFTSDLKPGPVPNVSTLMEGTGA